MSDSTLRCLSYMIQYRTKGKGILNYSALKLLRHETSQFLVSYELLIVLQKIIFVNLICV